MHFYQDTQPPPIKKKGKPIITQSAKWYKIMERIKELEKELEKVCGKYENHWSITQCATTVRVLASPAKGQQIKYITDASIKRLTNRNRLYIYRF